MCVIRFISIVSLTRRFIFSTNRITILIHTTNIISPIDFLTVPVVLQCFSKEIADHLFANLCVSRLRLGGGYRLAHKRAAHNGVTA